MKKFVNCLSWFRIIAAFGIVPLLMYKMYWLAFVVYVLAALSDFFDGYLAKKYNATSKLGGVLDHIGDKLLVINIMIMMAAMMPIWFIVVPIVLLIAREIYVSGLREFMGTQKMEMPVDSSRGYFSMAKVKLFLQMIAIGAFMLMFAMNTLVSPEMTSRSLMYVIYMLPQIGIWGMFLATIASLWSAAGYTIDFARKLKAIETIDEIEAWKKSKKKK